MALFTLADLHLSLSGEKPMDVFGGNWVNFEAHLKEYWEYMVRPEDTVVVPGDISWAMKFDDAVADLDYISKLKGYKIIIKGNHDYWWKGISNLRADLPPKMYALQNDAMKIDNVVVCGSRGWVVPETTHKTPEDEKIYKRELIRLELSLKSAAHLREDGDIVICMMHFPPFNSKLEDNEYTALMEKYGVNYVVYGHLHNYAKKQQLVVEKSGVKYFLTSCDLVKNQLVDII